MIPTQWANQWAKPPGAGLPNSDGTRQGSTTHTVRTGCSLDATWRVASRWLVVMGVNTGLGLDGPRREQGGVNWLLCAVS